MGAFTSYSYTEILEADAGVLNPNLSYKIDTFTVNYTAPLNTGKFAIIKSGNLANMDKTATPVVAGLVLQSPVNAIESGETYVKTGDGAVYQVDVVSWGLATVAVKAGDTPAKFGAVYAVNTDTTVSNATKASVKITGIDTGASTVDAFTITVNGVAVNTASLDFSSVTNGTQLATVLGGISGLDVAYTSTDNGTLTVTASTAGAKVFTAVTLTASNVAVGTVGTPINGTDAVINGEDLGKATTTATDNVLVKGYFNREIKSGVWEVFIQL